MEQYPVPQFIEEESKITSFLTMRQFIYLIVTGAILFVLYSILPFAIFIMLALIIGIAGVGLAFMKVNGVPLLTLIFGYIGFSSSTKGYTWKKKESLYPFKTVQRAPLRKVDEENKIGLAQKSSLKKLRTQVELKTK